MAVSVAVACSTRGVSAISVVRRVQWGLHGAGGDAGNFQAGRAHIHGTASIAQLVEHALRKRTVVGSIPTGGFFKRLLEIVCRHGPKDSATEACSVPPSTSHVLLQGVMVLPPLRFWQTRSFSL